MALRYRNLSNVCMSSIDKSSQSLARRSKVLGSNETASGCRNVILCNLVSL